MIELIILIIVLWVVALIGSDIDIDWKCVFGKHNYVYIGIKTGMYYNTKTEKMSFTKRKIYQCYCGKLKAAEEKDYE